MAGHENTFSRGEQSGLLKALRILQNETKAAHGKSHAELLEAIGRAGDRIHAFIKELETQIKWTRNYKDLPKPETDDEKARREMSEQTERDLKMEAILKEFLKAGVGNSTDFYIQHEAYIKAMKAINGNNG
jgi:hypothetical protein